VRKWTLWNRLTIHCQQFEKLFYRSGPSVFAKLVETTADLKDNFFSTRITIQVKAAQVMCAAFTYIHKRRSEGHS
jgi:hypothetical protein